MASTRLLLTPAAAAASLLCIGAYAQAPAPTTLPPVTVTGRSDPVVSVSGWGSTTLSETPVQASLVTSAQMKDRGVQRLADVVKSDASVSDAYNSEGYWDFIAVRGFTLDNRFNYRRDGLPINAETSIPLDNKERLEVLKGTSGMQAGTSAPGGLVNYIVKRPLAQPAYSATLGWRERNTSLAAADLSQRFGSSGAVGARLNLAYEDIEPQLRSAEGKRHLVALATDWRVTSDTLVELEGETSRRSQPSQPGFSLLGNSLPQVRDARINLNNQPWSQPVVMDANTASLRVTHKFDGWQVSLHGVTQRLRTDDRLAFPFGCSDPNPPPTGTYYPDRYCPDGTYDLYDYRSENERRRSDALEVAARGDLKLADMTHQWSIGMLQSRVQNRFGFQSYDPAGTGNVDGTLVTPPNDPRSTPNTNRDERTSELFVRDMVKLNDHLGLWLGLRHTRLKRESIQTNGSEGTSFEQLFNTPFFATSYTFAPNQMVYASWGRGTESDVVPNRPQYSNGGQALPAARSRQLEAGLKVSTANATWGFAWFDIKRPVWGDDCAPPPATSCTRILDGNAHHEGLEANAAWRDGAWNFQGSLQALRAHRHDSTTDPAVNGKRPTNVPVRTVKLQVRYDAPQLPGLSTQADLLAVSDRAALPDNSISIPGYAVTDLSLKFVQKAASTLTWRLGVDNAFDRRVWRESPHQYGHVYLYPLAPRTFRASLEVTL
ncbi:TonB-dependent siderophore receptor [Rhizobacter sp. J219]|uniref:TonB-dependent siderophore receptor n=1 Tax=Rhizobacter sp. J219 TaxID=2898430 RepID=UPI00215126B0|nr:TonB-dependent siderophore receptor [Rhizobacter sp. J219]MCR5882758.1 TonB-dependent siderophore receptor [Rhizobacter sp. J219]